MLASLPFAIPPLDDVKTLGTLFGYALAIGAIFLLLLSAFRLGLSPAYLNIILLITGALIGWVVGILLTPVSAKEAVQFSEYGKALATFVTGYLVAKFDKLFELSVKEPGDVNAVSIGRISLFVSGFCLGALATYVWRAYVLTAV